MLYLVKTDLLTIPSLYLSRYIVRHKADYYRLLQSVRDRQTWAEWIGFMLDAITATAGAGIKTIRAIKTLLGETKLRLRENYRFYSQDLLNNLFQHPYTKIEFLMRDLKISRLTATNYLNQLAAAGILRKEKKGRANYYINEALCRIFTRNDDEAGAAN